jgi:WD40 repeat protein
VTTPLECPAPACWQALFDRAVPPAQEELYEQHLESCPTCQERLDRAEEYQDELRRLGQQLGDPTTLPADPTLSEVLERLQEEGASTLPGSHEPTDLYFLAPTEQPGVLGTLGDYQVVEVIGEGGMGVVLKAYDPPLHRLVAIKVLAAAVAGSAVARRRFTREAQAAAAVCHDHIVAVHGVHEADGLPYLVMQYVSGESLQARLDRTGPLELREIVRIGLQTASALAAAHAQGLIHRDIKPANLLLENGLAKVKITDFGLARMADDVGLTRDGVVAGTPEYMAPEQARGEPVDHRADLFSLGGVVYACCTGRPPFRAATALAVLQQVNTDAPAPVRSLNPEVPDWLGTLIERLMSKNPDDRFQSASEVANLLEGYLAHLQQPVTVPAPEIEVFAVDVEPRSRSIGRTRRRITAFALVALAVFGLIRLFPFAAQDQPRQQVQVIDEIYQDFRGEQGVRPPLQLVGPDAATSIKAEKEGARITLPANRKKTDRVGIQLDSRLRGDFEITATYEILHADQPTQGHGVGVELFVSTVAPASKELGLFRASRVNEGEVYMSSLSPIVDGQRQYRVRHFEASAKAGRLRITRIGSEAITSIAEADATEFKELCREDLGAETVNVVRVSAYTGHAPHAVDLRIKDLRIRPLSTSEAKTLTAQSNDLRAGGNKGWLAAAGIVVLTTTGVAVAAWLLARRRRRATTKPAGVPQEARAEGAPATFSFSCSSCGKKLRAKTTMAAQQVKCPQCGTTIRVPSIQTGLPPSPQSAKAKKRPGVVVWLLSSLLALLLVGFAGGWWFWPRAPKQSLSFVNVTVGCEVVPGVEDSGFHFQEYDVGTPFRWTDGNGRLVIPIDRTKPPEKLLVRLQAQRGPGTRKASLQVVVNRKSIFKDDVPLGRWEKVLDLAGIDLGDRVVVDLRSDTFNPYGTPRHDRREQSSDGRELGFQVLAIKLIRDEDAPPAEPARTFENSVSLPQAHPWTVAFGSLSSDGKTLVTGSLDGTVAIWDTEKREPRTLRVDARLLFALAISPDGETFATAGGERVVRLWSTRTLRPSSRFSGHTGRVLALAFSPDGKTLATAGDDPTNGGELKFWDLATGKERFSVDPYEYRVWGLAYSPDGSKLAIIGGERTAQIVNPTTGKELTSFALPASGRAVAFSADGGQVAVACGQDGRVYVHDAHTGKLSSEFQAPGRRTVHDVQFARDGKDLLTACGDGAVLWDTSDPQPRPVARLVGHEGPVRWALFSPDGQSVLSGGEDRVIRWWNLGKVE